MKLSQTLKEIIHDACYGYVRQRAETALQAIASVSAAGEEDTKSSAGDKYETGREMMKQEIGRHQTLLADAQQMEAVLDRIDLMPRDAAGPGSLIRTDQALFYLAIGIGKLSVAGEEVLVLSSSAPIGRLLTGRSAGDTFSFNTRIYKIWEVG